MEQQQDSTSDAQVVQLRQDIRSILRRRLREAVEIVLEEELSAALGSGWYERSEGRRGYRNGSETRRVTTAAGDQSIRVPRGRLVGADGSQQEFRSEILPRYARRTKQVDEAILSVYLAGGNSRRIRKALEPLLGSAHLSKSAVSRVVARLKSHFTAWKERSLSAERYAVLFLDGFHLKVRLARRVVAVPVLAALGVAEDGTKVLVGLELAVSEAAGHWKGLIGDLRRRGLAAPKIVVTDGHAGLRKAVEAWPDVKIQRCTQHKQENLLQAAPVHARREVRRDYRRIIDARDGLAARQAYDAFVAKWSTLCPAVVRSLEEAGAQLLTFFEFPKGMWRSLRTTNCLENLNREFRRRTKTQASFCSEEAAVTLLYGLVAFGQIRLRKIDGHHHVAALLGERQEAAA
jgi:transposase-like protein